MLIEESNQTTQNRFILLGLTSVPYLQALYFLIFLVMYAVTLLGNSLLVIVVRLNTQLQTPMYFFLSNLSIVDICLSSSVVPSILVFTLAEDKSISSLACALQMFFSLVLGATECLLLAVMAWDRYAAICKPLHYCAIMNKRFCICMVAVCWAVGFINSFTHVLLTFQLPFCRSHHVNHFFCEVPPFLQLSCRDTWLNEVAIYISAGTLAMCSFSLTFISYVHIMSTILKIHSTNGRYKVFSTCTSHLTAVSLYYGTIMFMYMRPRAAYSPETDKNISVIYTAVIPMLNPIIYSIRNKDIKGSVKKNIAKIISM